MPSGHVVDFVDNDQNGDVADEDLCRLRDLLASPADPAPLPPPDPEPDTDMHTRLQELDLHGLPRLLASRSGRKYLVPKLLAHFHLPPDLLLRSTPLDAWRAIQNAMLAAGIDPDTWLPLSTAPPEPPEQQQRRRATLQGLIIRHFEAHDTFRWSAFSHVPRTTIWQTVRRLRVAGWQIVADYGIGYQVLSRPAP